MWITPRISRTMTTITITPTMPTPPFRFISISRHPAGRGDATLWEGRD
jgi:hypothetical protein